jgi:hypothetical protein
MRKTLTALATAATVAVAAIATPTGAEARWGGWHGGWRGPGIVGGLIAGGLIAGALAPRYYGYPGYYGYYDGGYDNGPYYGCWRRHWNGYGWVRYRVC